MVEEAKHTLAYLCPARRQSAAVERSVFQLAASANELPCPRGKSSLQMELMGDRVKLTVPCLFCSKDHTITCSSHVFLHGKVLVFSCAASGLDCCYAGEEGPVSTALQRLEEAVDKLEAASGEKGAFLGELVMQEVLSGLKEIARRNGISCTCGSCRWRLQVSSSSIDLFCTDCGGAIRIPAVTASDIDGTCCKSKLVIHSQDWGGGSMMVHKCEYMVYSRDINPWCHCHLSGLIGMLQEAATQAACTLHVSRDEMLERYNSFWTLAQLWYRLDVPLSQGDTVHVRTWHRDGRGASTYRDFDLFVNGQPVGGAVSTWVLADATTHKLAYMGRITEFQGTDNGSLCKERTLSRVRLPGTMEHTGGRAMHYSDTDVNDHVNNARYVDFLCDALHMGRLGPNRFVSSPQVGYLTGYMTRETIELYTGQVGGLQYVRGTDQAGESRFDSAVELAELTS